MKTASQITAKEVGDRGERLAARYLRRHGYRIRAKNWFDGKRELDIVASTWLDIAFVEVKTRTYTQRQLREASPPSVAVGREKQRLTRQAAARYLYEHPTKKRPRMDVIEVWLLKDEIGNSTLYKIHHIKAAY